VGLLVGLAALSVFINCRAATTVDVHRWNADPVDVDRQPERLWDWRDPQFLRGLTRTGRAA
jgi:hypothetical protein